MAVNSAITWTGATWNPATGCTKTTRGRDHCNGKRFERGSASPRDGLALPHTTMSRALTCGSGRCESNSQQGGAGRERYSSTS